MGVCVGRERGCCSGVNGGSAVGYWVVLGGMCVGRRGGV